MTIHNRVIRDTPICFIDFETTGLVSGYDRVIEVGVVRMDPGDSPKIIFDSLINPGRRVTGTSIHGITDDDVEYAPDFRDIAGDIVDAISGSVVSSYNVYFDIPFLEYELSRAGIKVLPPYFCMMYMRPLLKLGSKCRLAIACKEHGISTEETHVASADVLATANLFRAYLDVLQSQGIETFGDLAKLKEYKYFQSFKNLPLPSAEECGLIATGQQCPRSPKQSEQQKADEESRKIASYWEALKAVVADLTVTEDEMYMIYEERKRLNLGLEQMRAMHAKIFAAVVAQFIDDEFLDGAEMKKLNMLWKCLDALGWAPGQFK